MMAHYHQSRQELERHCARKNLRARHHELQRHCTLSNPPVYISAYGRFADGHTLTQGGTEYDGQQQALYSAERRLSKGDRFDDIEEARDYVDYLTSLSWMKRRWPDGWRYCEVEMKSSRATRKIAHAEQSGLHGPSCIRLSPHALYQRVVLHELAHVLTPKPHPWHGRLFARVFLALIEWRYGDEAAETLKEAYREKNVNYYPHRECQYQVSLTLED